MMGHDRRWKAQSLRFYDEIVSFLSSDFVSTREISLALKVSTKPNKRTLRSTLERMVDEGLVERAPVKYRNKNCWRLTKQVARIYNGG